MHSLPCARSVGSTRSIDSPVTKMPHGRLMILPGGHGDYLGELLTPAHGDRYAELTAWLIEEFLDGPA
jgi:hypothetical protein